MSEPAESFELRAKYDQLREDRTRTDLGFSEDIQLVNSILFNSFAEHSHRKKAIERWLTKNQPCVFGQIAAAKNRIHFCIITDQDLQRSDQFVSQLIKRELLRWKRRSVRPTKEFSIPAHGFVLVVASQRVAYASADDRLKEFAEKVLELWGCAYTDETPGRVFWETLYLQNRSTMQYVRFTFSVDFFAAQGDGEWWHDHRFPGGIAFTANSVGHMIRFKQWYEGTGQQEDWSLRLAMRTIDSAAETKFGRATWLKSLPNDGLPAVPSLTSPLRPDEFAGRDWTKYGGWLHTDMSVRPEFFASTPPNSSSYNQDFAYLYDPTNGDHAKFVAGEPVEFDEITDQIGNPADYVEVEAPIIQADEPIVPSNQELADLLERTRVWELSPQQSAQLYADSDG